MPIDNAARWFGLVILLFSVELKYKFLSWEVSLRRRLLLASVILVVCIVITARPFRIGPLYTERELAIDLGIDSFSSVLNEEDGIQIRVGRVKHESYDLAEIEFRIWQLVDDKKSGSKFFRGVSGL